MAPRKHLTVRLDGDDLALLDEIAQVLMRRTGRPASRSSVVRGCIDIALRGRDSAKIREL